MNNVLRSKKTTLKILPKTLGLRLVLSFCWWQDSQYTEYLVDILKPFELFQAEFICSLTASDYSHILLMGEETGLVHSGGHFGGVHKHFQSTGSFMTSGLPEKHSHRSTTIHTYLGFSALALCCLEPDGPLLCELLWGSQ